MRGKVLGERYQLERQLGHGSMAEVWLAEDLELERPVAPSEPVTVGSAP